MLLRQLRTKETICLSARFSSQKPIARLKLQFMQSIASFISSLRGQHQNSWFLSALLPTVLGEYTRPVLMEQEISRSDKQLYATVVHWMHGGTTKNWRPHKSLVSLSNQDSLRLSAVQRRQQFGRCFWTTSTSTSPIGNPGGGVRLQWNWL